VIVLPDHWRIAIHVELPVMQNMSAHGIAAVRKADKPWTTRGKAYSRQRATMPLHR